MENQAIAELKELLEKAKDGDLTDEEYRRIDKLIDLIRKEKEVRNGNLPKGRKLVYGATRTEGRIESPGISVATVATFGATHTGVGGEPQRRTSFIW